MLGCLALLTANQKPICDLQMHVLLQMDVLAGAVVTVVQAGTEICIGASFVLRV